jgi:hypothetical protein
MADPLGYFFSGADPASNNANFILRQKIAMALLGGKKGYPTTLGQGLTALGDAIGNLRLRREMEQSDVAAQREAMGTPGAPSTPQPQAAYTPGDATRDTADEPPARAETPLYTAPSQPSSMIASSLPTGLTSPQPTLRDLGPGQAGQGAGAGTSPSSSSPAASDEEAGGYNVIDAQAGTQMQPSPEYVREAIARTTSNPDMQAYLGNLAAKEGPRPGMVSKSGAAGPFQFVPGTAKQYGLTNPNDPNAAAQAALQLTADNAAQFTRINGRPPNMQELALMHQQGGATGARMAAGTGNASPRNLLLNNIQANASPQAAVSKINNYYGMPDRAVDPRAGVAQAMMAQGGTPRVMNADDAAPQQTSFNTQNALPMPSQQAAPQAAPPQMQVAQAPAPGQTAPIPGYVMPAEREPQAPTMIQPSAREYELTQKVQAMAMRNPYAMTGRDAQELAVLKQNREFEQARQVSAYNERLQAFRAKELERQKQLADQAQRTSNYEKQQFELGAAKDKEALSQRLGGRDPEKFITQFTTEKTGAQQSENVIRQAALARDAIKNGVITGIGAESRINGEKLKAWMLNNKRSGDLASNTEQLRAATNSMLNVALTNIQGATRTNISDTDVKIATGMIAADPRLQQQTIEKIIGENEKIARGNLNDFEDKRHYYLSGTRLERDFNFPTKPSAPDKYIDVLLKNNDEATRKEFDDRFGKGAADLEIARAKRAKMRGGP